MALLDPYVDVPEYNARANATDARQAAVTREQALAASRIFERECGVVPGYWNQTEADTVRYLSGRGTAKLWLTDPRRRLQGLVSIASEGVAVDTTGDGSFDTTFDATETWLVRGPVGAAEFSEPYTWLELRTLDGSVASVGEVLTVWPRGVNNVRVTGVWGYPAVPPEVREVVGMMVRDMRERMAAGSAGTYQMLDSGIVVKDTTWATIRRMRDDLSRKIPSIV